MDITVQDLQQLQREAGQVENELRLRAIIAERMVNELQAQLDATKKDGGGVAKKP